jgi:hypothetical protein
LNSKGHNLDFLANEVGMPSNLVRQLMSFWVHKGVLQEKKTQNNQLTRKSLSTLGYFTANDQSESTSLIYTPVKFYEGNLTESNLVKTKK